MAKVKKAYFCKNCGFEAPKWLGRCPSCGEWNTFTEEIVARESGSVPANVAGSLPAAFRTPDGFDFGTGDPSKDLAMVWRRDASAPIPETLQCSYYKKK